MTVSLDTSSLQEIRETLRNWKSMDIDDCQTKATKHIPDKLSQDLSDFMQEHRQTMSDLACFGAGNQNFGNPIDDSTMEWLNSLIQLSCNALDKFGQDLRVSNTSIPDAAKTGLIDDTGSIEQTLSGHTMLTKHSGGSQSLSIIDNEKTLLDTCEGTKLLTVALDEFRKEIKLSINSQQDGQTTNKSVTISLEEMEIRAVDRHRTN